MGERTTVPENKQSLGSGNREVDVASLAHIQHAPCYYYYPDDVHALNGTEKTTIPNTQMWAKIHVQRY